MVPTLAHQSADVNTVRRQSATLLETPAVLDPTRRDGCFKSLSAE